MAKATKKRSKKNVTEEPMYKVKLNKIEVAILKLAFDSFSEGVDEHVKKMIKEADNVADAEAMGDEMIMDVARFKVKVEAVFKSMLKDMAMHAAKEAGLDLDPEQFEIVYKAHEAHEHNEDCGGLN